MPNPVDLPLELFNEVVDHTIDGRNDVKSLCDLSLVDYQWHAALNTRIYSTWLYDGYRCSISSLWKFLRTILCNRRIANEVRTLQIRNWSFGFVHGRNRVFFSEDDFELVRNAIYKAGIQQLEWSFMEALRKTDPRPLMALLLTSLPNLTTLYAHLPETDIFLAEVLKRALEGQKDKSQNQSPPLQNLREAHLASVWNYREDWRARDKYTLKLGHLWPVFQLPTIRKLSVFDFDPLGASIRFGNIAKASGITDLTIVLHGDSMLAASDALALLALPKALISLSIYLNDCDLLKRDPKQFSNAGIWKGLGQHQSSVEHLDIYRDCTGCGPPVHSPKNSYLGSLHAFRRLKSLRIQPEVLLGGCCGNDMAPFSLRDTLPPNLESLTIYGDEGLALNKSLGEQLQEVLTSTNFPGLNHVILEETFNDIRCYIDPAHPPHEEVKRVCRERGVHFETKRGHSLSKGGIGLRYYRYVKQMRLQMDAKLQKVRYAVSERLYRLSETMSADSSHQPELSSDDLDSYELPWDELTEEVLYPEATYEAERDSEEWDLDELDSEDVDSQELDSQDDLQGVNSEDSEVDTGNSGFEELDSDGVW